MNLICTKLLIFQFVSRILNILMFFIRISHYFMCYKFQITVCAISLIIHLIFYFIYFCKTWYWWFGLIKRIILLFLKYSSKLILRSLNKSCLLFFNCEILVQILQKLNVLKFILMILKIWWFNAGINLIILALS